MSGIYIAKDEKHYQEIIEKAKSDEKFNMHFTLIGTKDMIIEQIKTFKELGATDIMLNNHHNFQQKYHFFQKKLNYFYQRLKEHKCF